MFMPHEATVLHPYEPLRPCPDTSGTAYSRSAGRRMRPAMGWYQGHRVGALVEVKKPRVLIIVQNLPVPFDRRVWLECQALASAGYRVAAVCPKGSGDPSFQVIDGVELYKYRPYAPGGSKLSFIAEYAYSFLATAWLTLRARRSRPVRGHPGLQPAGHLLADRTGLPRRGAAPSSFSTTMTCAPSCTSPASPTGPRLPYRGLRALERRTHRAADHVISTNDSYRDIAINRSGKPPATTSPSSAPARTPSGCRRGPADPAQRRGRRYLAAYIGVMGPQDGVDIVVRAADIVVHELGRDDIAFTLIGSGDCFDELVALRDELGLAGHVEFTGRAPDELVARILSTADVGLSPDPEEPAQRRVDDEQDDGVHGLRAAGSRVRPAGDPGVGWPTPAVYVRPNDVREYAQAIVELMDDEPRRSRAGQAGPGSGGAGAGLEPPAARLPRRVRQLTNGDWTATAEVDMCGIAGCYQQADGQKLADIMTDRIAHRGPDATGFWSHEDDRVSVQLGHRRLSIIDLSARRRPAAVQGRPDARLQRRAVQLQGACGPSWPAAASASSPPPTPRSCSRPGATGDPARCAGSAACSRSRCSTRRPASSSSPVTRSASSRCTTCRGATGVVFASELKALVAAVGPELRIEPGALVASMLYYWVPDQRCAIEGVQKLPPGPGRDSARTAAAPVRALLAGRGRGAAEAAAEPGRRPGRGDRGVGGRPPGRRRAGVQLPVRRPGLEHRHRAGPPGRPRRSTPTRSPSGPRTSGSRPCPTTPSTPARSRRSSASSCTRSRSPPTSSTCCPASSTSSTSRSATRPPSTPCSCARRPATPGSR